nr:hypothetical protein [Agrobacterium tumefaciens]
MNNAFVSVDDMWRRTGVPSEALVQLAKADAFLPSLKLARRDALWAIKALRDQPLPLFAAAAEREMAAIAEQQEPEVALRQMTDGHNVIEDCNHTGLTLRQHPIASCARIISAQHHHLCRGDEFAGRALGLYRRTCLVRQKPGSANGVMFITIEDETGPANLVVWPTLFEKTPAGRARILDVGASMVESSREGESVNACRPAAVRPVRRSDRSG